MNKWSRQVQGDRSAKKPKGRAPSLSDHHYFAFISYSHDDSKDADWLHRELERFRVPKSLAGRLTANGVIPDRLAPIFRDRQELGAAHDLGGEIKEALTGSRCLIVLCSPAAADSKWTNTEIKAFKRAHPDGCIIAAILRGEPFASEIPGREGEECFPPALRYKFDRRGRMTAQRAEPLAADLRDSADGRRLGFLKIVAGILGLGLDDLVQRDLLRRQRRLATIAAGSLGGMILAFLLALTAITARDEARDQRRAAESLVGFMLGDLKDKLEPIGRLDVLGAVGARALAYYERQDMSDLPDEALAQRSKALTLLGQVARESGDLDSAIDFYRAAFAGSAETLRRAPEDTQRIFDHAQNVFYLGEAVYARGQLPQATRAMREYKRLAGLLVAADRTNSKWQLETIYADSNLGVMLYEQRRYVEAAALFQNALGDRERLAASDPASPDYRGALIEGLGWLSSAREVQGRLDDALAVRERQIRILVPLATSETADFEHRRQAASARRAAGRIQGLLGNNDKASANLAEALRISTDLLRVEPNNTTIRSLFAGTAFDFAHVLLAAGKTDESADLVKRACDQTEQLIAKDSTVREWRLDLVSDCGTGRARIALAKGMTMEAARHASELRAHLLAEVRRSDTPDARMALAGALILQGLVERQGGNGAAAQRAFRSAESVWPSITERPNELALRAIMLKGAGKAKQSAAVAQQLTATGYRDSIYLREMRSLG